MSDKLDYRPSYLAAAIAAGATFLLYLITLSPETAMWDTSEYIAAAYTMGLPHPPGNPFFVLIGRVFSILPIAPSVAMRINLLAALSSAASAGMWFLITERVLVGWLEQRWQRIVGGALAVLIGATAFTVWSQSVVNEKVYTVSLVGLAICAWLVVRWCDDPDGPKADKLLILVAYLCGVGYANHMAGLLAIPATGIAVLVRRPATLLRWKLILVCAAALFLGGSSFATQPIRAAHNPPINEGSPTACMDGLKVSCTFSKGTYDAFMYNFNRGQYGKPALSQRQAPFPAQLQMYWDYFRWQWFRDHHNQHASAQGMLAMVYLFLVLLGGWVHYRRDRRSFAFFGPLMLTLTFVLIYYMNFRYGASQAPDLGGTVDREPRDRDYFFLWSFSAMSVWAALGMIFVWETFAEVFGRKETTIGEETISLPTSKAFMMTSPLLAFAFVPLFLNWDSASRRGETDTADFAIDLLNSVEPYGVLVTVGDNDTFPLWYAQEVLGVRRDVTVANTSLMNTEWYVHQMIRRPVFEYDTAAGPTAYKGKAWPKPDGPVLKMSFEDADRIPIGQEITQPMLFQSGKIRAVIAPRPGEGSRFLEKAHILVLRMIQDNPGRAVHFSRTSADLAEELGLGAYTVSQGLARKVLPDSAKEGPGMVTLPGSGIWDVARSDALWKEMKAPASLIEKNDWIDAPSSGIPLLYLRTGIDMAELYQRLGRKAEADSAVMKSYGVCNAMRIGPQCETLKPVPALPAVNPDSAGDSVPRTTVPAKRP